MLNKQPKRDFVGTASPLNFGDFSRKQLQSAIFIGL
jgi:hypothetical protein